MAVKAVSTAERTADQPLYRYEGIYEPSEAAGYLLAGMPLHLQQRRRPTPRRVHGWIREGLVAFDQRHVPWQDRVIDFEDIISCQVITLLQQESKGSLARVRAAERLFAERLRTPKPFAHYDFWDLETDILGAFGDYFAIAGIGEGWWKGFFFKGMTLLSEHIRFNKRTGRPEEWEPVPGITLVPGVQFGQPCLKDTRIPTGALWSYIAGGDTPTFVAEGYGIKVADVERAFEWEQRIRVAIAEVTGISP
ncbi:MAG: DUF433 domain-containing protein [Chloroflexota bacterium]